MRTVYIGSTTAIRCFRKKNPGSRHIDCAPFELRNALVKCDSEEVTTHNPYTLDAAEELDFSVRVVCEDGSTTPIEKHPRFCDACVRGALTTGEFYATVSPEEWEALGRANVVRIPKGTLKAGQTAEAVFGKLPEK